MFRLPSKLVFLAVLVTACAGMSEALTLISPTRDQTVREKVKITVPAASVPADGFVALFIGQKSMETFVFADKPVPVKGSDGNLRFYWDSKAPYRDSSDQKTDKYFKDGGYSLKVQIHDGMGRLVDSGVVDVTLKNKVDRPNPSPASNLANSLSFGQMGIYGVHANVQVFDKVGLPILGGLGMTSDFKIVESVEDVRPDGIRLLRYRIGEKPSINVAGGQVFLYTEDALKPQLYRLVNKYGNVLKANMFTKQAGYTIMDIIPTLAGKPVKEGDSWPDTFNLKIEGLTDLTQFTGTAMLDSFEWQGGHKCAKLISNVSGKSIISLANGTIHSSSGSVSARVTTYFAQDTGKLLRREVAMEFPAIIEPGAEELTGESVASAASAATPPGMMGPMGPPMPPSPTTRTTATGKGGATGSEETGQRGTVQINVVVQLEK